MARLADTLKYPVLGQAEAGTLSRDRNLKRDRMGRRAIRVNQVPDNYGDYSDQKGTTGGKPRAKGVESFIPQALSAARLLKMPGHKVTNPAVLRLLFANRAGKGSPGSLRETVLRLARLRGRS